MSWTRSARHRLSVIVVIGLTLLCSCGHTTGGLPFLSFLYVCQCVLIMSVRVLVSVCWSVRVLVTLCWSVSVLVGVSWYVSVLVSVSWSVRALISMS